MAKWKSVRGGKTIQDAGIEMQDELWPRRPQLIGAYYGSLSGDFSDRCRETTDLLVILQDELDGAFDTE